MPAVIIIAGHGGEDEYQSGTGVMPGTNLDRLNMGRQLQEDAARRREELRSERAEKRYRRRLRGREGARRA